MLYKKEQFHALEEGDVLVDRKGREFTVEKIYRSYKDNTRQIKIPCKTPKCEHDYTFINFSNFRDRFVEKK